jgi:hypothetical protein
VSHTRRERASADGIRIALLVALLAWSGWALTFELRRFVREYQRPPQPLSAAEWRLPSEQARELGVFLAEAGDAIVPGAVVVVAAGRGADVDAYFVCQWVAYLLPRNRVVCSGHPAAATAGEYIVAYQGPMENPRLTELYRHQLGRVYRIER